MLPHIPIEVVTNLVARSHISTPHESLNLSTPLSASEIFFSTNQSRSVAHQENKRAYVPVRCRIPIPKKDGVDHKPSLTFTEQNVTQCLRHQIAARKPDEDRYWVDALADERNRVGDGNSAVNLREIVVALFLIIASSGRETRRGCQADLQGGTGMVLDAIVFRDLFSCFVHRPRSSS